MFGQTLCNWDCAFIYNSKKGAPINQPRNDFALKHICIVKQNTNLTYADMEGIAKETFDARIKRGDRIPASTVVITNVNGFLEMDSWMAGKGTSGMNWVPVLNGAIFTYDPTTRIAKSSAATEIQVTVKIGTNGRKNVDHMEPTREDAKTPGKFTTYSDTMEGVGMIPWWLFGSASDPTHI
jgi:hypothetical protein